MTVFYTASYLGKEKYQKYYDAVREAIEETGVKIISPEKGNYLNALSKAEKESLGDPKLVHYEAIRRGIAQADVVIIEISNEDFQLGHEATLAVQAKKPVLCLSVYEDFSEKIKNRFFFGAKYNQFSAYEIVGDFIRRFSKNHLTERFNCFLSPAQMDYLAKAGEKEGLNRSEYLRKLIDADREGAKDKSS